MRRPPIAAAVLGALLGLLLHACAAPVAAPYAPGSSLSARGSVGLGEIRYLPAESGRVAANQLRNAELQKLLIEPDVKTYVADALARELRFIGIRTDAAVPQLGGLIREFSVDDFSAHPEWRLTIGYQLRDASGALIYAAEKTSTRRTVPQQMLKTGLSEVLRANIEALVRDPDFLAATAAPTTGP